MGAMKHGKLQEPRSSLCTLSVAVSQCGEGRRGGRNCMGTVFQSWHWDMSTWGYPCSWSHRASFLISWFLRAVHSVSLHVIWPIPYSAGYPMDGLMLQSLCCTKLGSWGNYPVSQHSRMSVVSPHGNMQEFLTPSAVHIQIVVPFSRWFLVTLSWVFARIWCEILF
jgi:hypothetical protein